jgi:hypothetical protein
MDLPTLTLLDIGSKCHTVAMLELKQYFIHDDLCLWPIWILDFTGLHQLVHYLSPSRQSLRKLSHGCHVVILHIYSAEKLPWKKLPVFWELCLHTIWGLKCCQCLYHPSIFLLLTVCNWKGLLGRTHVASCSPAGPLLLMSYSGNRSL